MLMALVLQQELRMGRDQPTGSQVFHQLAPRYVCHARTDAKHRGCLMVTDSEILNPYGVSLSWIRRHIRDDKFCTFQTA